MSPSGFRALFEAPKPKLVQFNIRARPGAIQVVYNIFQVLAEKVPTLQQFEYRGPVPPLHLLPPFVAANPNMKTVTLRLPMQGIARR